MAELRRIALTSTPLISEKIPSIQTAKREFPPGNKDVSFTTVFFYVEEPSEELCPQYDFTKLLDVSKAPDGSEGARSEDPFDERTEEEKLTKLAKHFEDKYGTNGPRDLRELGEGYDQNDPFVDDSESAEAVIPSGWTPQHGGFYISTGPLHIRPIRAGEEETRVYQSVETDDCLAAIKSLGQLNLKRKVREESEEKDDSEEETGGKVKRKRPSVIAKSDSGRSAAEISAKKTNPRTVASILAEHVEPIVRMVISPTESASEEPSDLRKSKADVHSCRSNEPENALVKATSAAGKPDSPRPDSEMLTTVLPNEVRGVLRELVNDLKHMAVTWEGGKCNFFAPDHNPDINRMLLELEYHCRQLRCGLRSSIFSHLAGHLPCTKETLIKRARKLRQDDIESKLVEILKKLNRAINDEVEDTGTDALSKQVKKLVAEAVGLKMVIYDLHKSRFPTHEEYIRYFTDNELVPMWTTRFVDKQTLHAETLVALGEALRPRALASKPSRPHISDAGNQFDIPPPVTEKADLTVRHSVAVATNHLGANTSQGGSDRKTIVNQQPFVTRIQYTTREELREERKRKLVPSEEPPSSNKQPTVSSSRSDRNRMGEGPSPFVPARPRSGDHIVDAGLDRKKERSLLPARTTSAVMTVQTLSRSSTPGSIVSARAEVSKPSKSSFGPPSKNGKAYQEQFQRPSKKEAIPGGATDLRSVTKCSSVTSGGTLKQYEDKERRSSREDNSFEPRIIAHSSRPIASSGEGSAKIASKSSSKHKSDHSKSSASSTLYNPCNSFSAASLSSPYSAFSNVPLMVGFNPDTLFAMGQYASVFPESYPNLSLLQGPGSAFNGVGNSFTGRSSSSSGKANSSSRTSPYPSGDASHRTS